MFFRDLPKDQKFARIDFGVTGEPFIAEKYHITGYPTLIVLDKNGTLVNLQTGYLGPDDLILLGKQSYKK